MSRDLHSECDEHSNIFLMAEDNPSDAELVKAMLSETFGEQYSIVCVDRFDKIVDALSDGTFEVLILDMNLPDRSGVDNVYNLGKNYPDLPIVVLTGQDDLDIAVESLQKGAQDYLSKKNVTPEILSRSLRYAKERKYIDLQLKRALEDAAYRNLQLESMAKRDSLTGLPNRTYFHDEVSRTLYRAERLHKLVGLLYFDLNGFKKVNDCYGHLIGDKLIIQVAERLKSVVRESDFLARVGGDEFIVVTDMLKNKEEVYSIVRRLLSVFDQPFLIEAHEIVSSCSIGVAYFPDANDLDLLVKQADFAMYEAKRHKTAQVCFYTQQMAASYARNQDIESGLGKALQNQEFTTYFQPIINTHNPELLQVEALVRWNSPRLGWVAPDEFIPVAEYTPAINGITHRVIEHSRDLGKKLAEINETIDRISINICASQLRDDVFANMLFEWADELEMSADKICLELTERQLVENVENCKIQLNRLRNKGFKIALDDFGTGYSSLTHLVNFPIDELKIDRKLITYIDQNNRNLALTAGIVEMAHRLSMQIVAEGVEREEEYQTLAGLGCDYLQGYYIAKPQPIDAIVIFLQLLKSN